MDYVVRVETGHADDLRVFVNDDALAVVSRVELPVEGDVTQRVGADAHLGYAEAPCLCWVVQRPRREGNRARGSEPARAGAIAHVVQGNRIERGEVRGKGAGGCTC